MGPRVSSPEFVGRGEELDAVQSTFSAVAGGRPATLLIGGEAGIGKSRLAEEIADRARAAGAVVATGVSVPIDGGLAYGPVVGILRDLGQDDGWGLVGSAATGRPAASYAAMPRLVEELAKTRLFESVLSGISARAQPSPLVLVFEDLHWADSASRELFGFLARSLADVPVLLVATYRSEALADDRSLRLWLTELGRHRRVAHLRLGGLSQDETASLLAGVLGRRPEPALASRIWARSQGNPFLAELLAAHGGAKGLPVELREMILADIEVLSSTARQLLELVATAGTAVDHRLLPPDADAAITELVEQRILAVDAHGRGYRFRQPLVREAVYETLLPGNRIRLHRTIAEMLTADPSLGPPAERAAHWWAAGDAEPALALSLQAADGAVAAMAFPEALGHLERALSALDRLPASGVDRGDLLERAADAAYIAGHGERSVALARAALEAVDQGTDPSTAARRYTLLGRNAWAAADPGGAFEAHRKAAALLPADRPSVGLARVLAEDARWLMLMSRFREAQARSHAAIAAARAVGDRAIEGHATNTLGCCLGFQGQYDEGIAMVRAALAIAEELAGPDDLNRAYANLSSLLLEAGRLEEAARTVFDGAAMEEQLWGVRLNGAAGNGTEALVRLGRYAEADGLLAQIGDHGLGVCAPGPPLHQATMAIRQGRFDDARAYLATADELTTGLSDVQLRGAFHLRAAELALEEGRPGDAADEAERALALAAGTDDRIYRPEMTATAVRALVDQVEAAATGGTRLDVDKARLAADELLDEVERIAGAGMPRASLWAATASAERSRLNEPEPESWAAAAAGWEAAGEPYPAAYCRWRQAEAVLESGGGRLTAEEPLRLAARASAALGAVPLLTRVEQLARRARIPLDGPADDRATSPSTVAADLGITAREVDVLGHLAAGHTDGEIADALFISKKTVSVHVSNLLRKLDAANRIEAGKIGQAYRLS